MEFNSKGLQGFERELFYKIVTKNGVFKYDSYYMTMCRAHTFGQ